jgi:hypothetical protein
MRSIDSGWMLISALFVASTAGIIKYRDWETWRRWWKRVRK